MKTPKLQWLVWGGMLAIALCIVVAFAKERQAINRLPIYASLPEFCLTNQNGLPVSQDGLRGQIWIVDTFFSRCPTQCLRMSKNMSELQAELPPDWRVKLVSITTDPGYDTPQVLAQYGRRYGANERWLFLTGDKNVITRLAVDAMRLVILDKEEDEKESPADLFIHSTKFVLIDQKGRVRGYFDGESPESRPFILYAIRGLLAEE